MKKILAIALVATLPHLALANSYDDLIGAVKMGDTATVSSLIKRGVDVDTTDPEGNTLLMMASRDGYVDLVDLLLSVRVKVNMRNSVGDSAMRLAAFKGHQKIIEKLIAAGGYVNTPDWTPLIYAAFNGHLEVAKTLIKAGADVNAASDNGTTALMVAARGGFLDLVKTLLAAQADANRANENGDTAVDLALRAQNTDIADVLRHAGGRSGKSVTIEIH